MKCDFCKTDNPHGSNFCLRCGKPFKFFSKPVSTITTVLIIVLTVIAFFVTLFILDSISLGENGILYYPVLILLLLSISGCCIKKVSNRTLTAFKKKSLYTFIAFITLFLIIIAVCIPVIRSIQGEDFLDIWSMYVFVLMVLNILIARIHSTLLIKKHAPDIINRDYSTNDLMLINRFSSCKQTAYYLYKMKLDGIVDIYKTSENNIDYVKINDALSQEDIDRYCTEFPNAKPIISYISSRHSDAVKKDISEDDLKKITRVIDVLCLVSVKIDANANQYHFYDQKKKELVFPVTLMFLAIALIAFLPAVLKIVMGIFFGKVASVLICEVFVLSIFYLVAMISCINETAIKKHWLSPINLKNNLYHCNNNADTLLRSCASGDAGLDQFLAMSIVSSVTIAEQAIAAAKRSSGSGCSSCSSCSGCGGGCGGCGGCGD